MLCLFEAPIELAKLQSCDETRQVPLNSGKPLGIEVDFTLNIV